ncbi:hypothetical protein CLV60_12630 [Dyadobacter jiangsuensis]|uniref:Uncharacterized protein n=1 Tax=Dyadobacter jiangsuensis TaxID=1591085 RepID=A0A2P8FCU7_9BACT|nr:hypothetical protein CLV60_12630 [Dyadobacter jiangsuensis]
MTLSVLNMPPANYFSTGDRVPLLDGYAMGDVPHILLGSCEPRRIVSAEIELIGLYLTQAWQAVVYCRCVRHF